MSFDGQKILFFSVSKGTSEIFQLPDGRCVRRRDKETIPIAVKQIINDRAEVKSREFDREFVDGATVADLDLPFIQEIANDYLKGLSVERYLQQLGLAEYSAGGLKLRRAAILLFAKDIAKWSPFSRVRFLEVIGTELKSGEHYNVRKDESVQGNIFELLQKAWERLRSYLVYKTEFGADAKFEQKYVYPEFACYEALVNSLAHRDYSVQNSIDIFVYDDRMEIKSPGSLLSTVTVESLLKLRGDHESRNVLISKTLRENKFMRELGEGMKRIFALMEENELSPPNLVNTTSSFSVTLSSRSVFSAKQEGWLGMFSHCDLSPIQKKIVVAGIDETELSPLNIYKAMNTKDRDTYDREVTFLRTEGVLVEIRSNSAAIGYAKRRGISKQAVPRFKIEAPTVKDMAQAATPVDPLYQNPNFCAFVTNISFSTTEDDIRNKFEQCGEIGKIDIPWERGFCFVWFKEQRSVIEAIRELSGSSLGKRTIYVKPYKPKR